MDENITFEFIEQMQVQDYETDSNDYSILLNKFNEIQNNEEICKHDSIFQEMHNYELNFSIRQLSFICEYYEIKITNKIKKIEMIELIIFYENNPDNIDTVIRRKEMWFYLNELKNDKKLKKYIINI